MSDFSGTLEHRVPRVGPENLLSGRFDRKGQNPENVGFPALPPGPILIGPESSPDGRSPSGPDSRPVPQGHPDASPGRTWGEGSRSLSRRESPDRKVGERARDGCRVARRDACSNATGMAATSLAQLEMSPPEAGSAARDYTRAASVVGEHMR